MACRRQRRRAVAGGLGLLLLFLFLFLFLLLGLERGGHARVVLGAKVELLVAGRDRDALVAVAALVGHQLVLALEGADVAHRDLELVGDPSVGAPLPDPGPNLVELGLE